MGIEIQVGGQYVHRLELDGRRERRLRKARCEEVFLVRRVRGGGLL